MKLTLPRWYDLHAHFRQGALLAPLLRAHREMGCAGVLAMPNTRPPVAVVQRAQETATAWSLEGYRDRLLEAGGDAFSTIIVPLYLTHHTTPALIEQGARSGLLQACKYYPPHGTTNADFGAPLSHYIDNGVFAAMQEHGIVLCVHGESHDLTGPAYFDRHANAEDDFYHRHLPHVVERFPDLRIVCEHITTRDSVIFVQRHAPQVAATITPQHLLYTIGDLVQGLRTHLYCLPVVKFEQDRAALWQAVLSPENTAFFAGTDSAPHTQKATPTGCAAGCYTGTCAPQLYAEAFEAAGADLLAADHQESFRRFLCLNGPTFYGLPIPQETFVLEREPQPLTHLETPEGPVTPLPVGLNPHHQTHPTTLSWRIL